MIGWPALAWSIWTRRRRHRGGGEEDLFEAIRAGASGYLLKDIPLDEVAPPLGQDTDGIEVVAGWQSAEVRARLPLLWR